MIKVCSSKQLEAVNFPLGELMMMLPAESDDPIIRELEHRLMVASKIATLLEDSLFYARMYKDTSEEGYARRSEMIDDAVDLVSVFRNGGLYP